MSYLKWFEEHAQKQRRIVQKLLQRGYTREQIVAYFDFDNMVEAEPGFCPLYAEKKKCHDMERLNCYLCACPNFRFNDEGLRRQGEYLVKSTCSIHNGATCGHNGVVHQDCSSCTVPHHEAYVLKHFDTEWTTIMAECPAEPEADED